MDKHGQTDTGLGNHGRRESGDKNQEQMITAPTLEYGSRRTFGKMSAATTLFNNIGFLAPVDLPWMCAEKHRGDSCNCTLGTWKRVERDICMTNQLAGGQFYFANGLSVFCIFSPSAVCHPSNCKTSIVSSWDFIFSQIFI